MRLRLLPAVLALAILWGISAVAQEEPRDLRDKARLENAIKEMQQQIVHESEEFTGEKLLALQEIDRLLNQRDGLLLGIESLRDDIRKLVENNTERRREIETTSREVAQEEKALEQISDFLGPAAGELAELIDTSIPGSDTQALQRVIPGAYIVDFDNGEISPIEINPVKTARKLFDLAGRLLTRSRLIERYQGSTLSAAGVLVDAGYLRIGEVASMYLSRDTGETGMLLRSPGEEHSRRYERSLPGSAASAIRKNLSEPPSQDIIVSVPVDVSQDMVVAVRYGEGGIVSYLARGGPVMIPLLAVALLAFVLVIERLISLRREGRGATRFANEIIDTYRTKGLASAIALAKGGRGAVARVMKAGLDKAGAPADIFEESLHEAALAELPGLERFLSTIAVLATVAPLLGLLGTVTGMISAFDTITAYGTSDPRLLSGGISEALVTTEIGLVIAIPVLLVHGFLSAKVDRITSDLEQASSRVIAAVTEHSAGQEPAREESDA